MIRAAAVDLENDNRVKITANFPTFPENGEENTLAEGLLSASAETLKGARILLNNRAQKPLVFGQLRLMLFSEELAKQGLEPYVDSLYRDPAVGNRIYLAIAEGDDAASFLEADQESGELSGGYLPDLIEHNMDTSILPSINMHQFLFSLYNDGRDPHLPVLKQGENGDFVWGTALFQGEKLHSMLDHDDSFILKIMKETARLATKQFEVMNEGTSNFVVIENISSKAVRKLDKSGVNPVFTIHITINGAIEDYNGEENLDDESIIKGIELSVESQISNQAEDLLKQFQKDSIDPVGFGEKYRSTTRNWDSDEWKNEIYPNAQFEVRTDLKIIQSGAIE
jgi:spore germination protein